MVLTPEPMPIPKQTDGVLYCSKCEKVCYRLLIEPVGLVTGGANKYRFENLRPDQPAEPISNMCAYCRTPLTRRYDLG